MPHTLSAADWEDQARSSYRKGDYSGALYSISNAINGTSKPSAAQLELRVASKEKLGDLDEALALTKSLIVAHPSDVRGYLRADRLLQKLKRPSAALKICERGLKAITPGSVPYATLQLRVQQLQRSLTQTIMSSKSIDPLERLPFELIQMVLLELSFSQRLPCMRVSKTWQKVIHSLPVLWRDLDLSFARRKVSSTFINKCFNLSHHSIEKAHIKNVWKLEVVIEALTKRCNSLSHLTVIEDRPSASLLKSLPMATNLTHLSITPVQIKNADVKYLLSRCSNLTSFWCTGVEGDQPRSTWECLPKCLKRLSLKPVRENGIERIHIESMVQHGSELTHLNLPGFQSAMIADTPLDLSPLGLEMLCLDEVVRPMNLPRTLKSIFHGSQSITRQIQVKGTNYYLPKLENVECLDIGSLSAFIDDPHDPNSNDAVPLVSVSVKWPSDSELLADALRNPAARLQNLRQLKFVMAKETDDAFVPVVAELKSIRSLDFTYSDITGYGVKRLVQELPLLEHLNLSFCKDVAADTFAWLREKKITVLTCGFLENSKERRVRYE